MLDIPAAVRRKLEHLSALLLQYRYASARDAAHTLDVLHVCKTCRCDNITIAPKLLGELEACTDPLPQKLWSTMGGCDEEKVCSIGLKSLCTRAARSDLWHTDRL